MDSRPKKQLTGLLPALAFMLIPLVALCAGAAGHASAPPPSPTPALVVNGRIAFTTTPDFDAGKFDRDINVVNADGTGMAPLVDTFSHQEDPAWSADGKYVAYTSAQNGYYEIYRADADGSNQTRLSDGVDVRAVDDSPAWSPDGQKIVFVRNRQLWTVGRDGGTAIKLSTGADEDEQPAWSPDGTKIAFVRNWSSANAQVWVMDADGTNQRNLSNDEWSFNRTPAWSPDGSRIAFHRWNHIWVMDADGSNQTQLTFPVGTAGGGYDKPSWSPDGTQIAVNGQFYEPEIFVMNADGSNIRKVADGSNPSWQPLPPLTLNVADSPDPVIPGASLTYTLVVTNNHSLTAAGATLTDALDAGTTFVSAASSRGSCAANGATVTCSLGDLAAGEQATVTLVVSVAAADGATLHNAATAAADYAGHGQQTQSAETSTRVITPYADVSVEAHINEGLYAPSGGQVVYGVYVFNSGPAPAAGVTLTGRLPAGVTLDDINNDGGSCAATAGGASFTCTFPSLDLYGFRAVILTATNGVSGAPYTPLTANFTIDAAAPGDNNPFNNAAAADFYIASPPLPAPTPGASNDGLLAFHKQLLSTGQHDVFRQRADGAGIVNMTESHAFEGIHHWSPDGSRLAFLRYDHDNQVVSLGTVGADGSGRTLLASVPGESIDNCSWSPDGTRLVFSARPYVYDTQGDSDVFVINADGTGRTNLTNGDGFNSDPSWSPDGTRIGYVRAVYGPEGLVSSEISVMGADGSGRVQIPQAAGEVDNSPRWSPDGSRLAFSRALPGGSADLYAARADGTDLRRLTDDATTYDTLHQWSPDGSKLSFNSYSLEDGSVVKLEVVNADGTGRSTIFGTSADGTSFNNGSDKWSPDGTRLVFDGCADGCFRQSIYVAVADGSGRVELGNGGDMNMNPDWSPDGRRVAFMTFRNGVSRINIINADGTGRVELPGEPGYHGAPMWQPRKAGDTPAGANVTVAENGVAVNFSNVTAAGVTTVTPIDPNSLQGVPGEYVIGAGSLAFEIRTTAAYEGPITIGFHVPGVNDPDTFSALRVLHGEPAPNFVDRTVLAPDSPAPDFATRTVYARVSSLSPFVVAHRKSSYNVRALYDETKTHKSGSTVPVKLQLTNAAGANLSSPTLVVRAVGTTRVSTNAAGVPEDAGHSNPDYDFRYDAGLSGYVYNLKTKGYAPGTYSLAFRVAGDPVTHTVQFRVTK